MLSSLDDGGEIVTRHTVLVTSEFKFRSLQHAEGSVADPTLCCTALAGCINNL